MSNFHQEMFNGNQVNRDYVNSQINKQTNYIMNQRNNSELFSHRTPPLLLMNNNKAINQGFNNPLNTEMSRIKQLSQSQSILDRYQKNTIQSMNMNNVLMKQNFQNTVKPVTTTQKYTAEIGSKRQLSNIIYNSIVKRFKNVDQNCINEKQIKYIIKQLKLSENPDKWTKPEVKKFSLVVKKLIQRNSKVKQKQVRKVQDDLFEANTKEKVHYVAIDSRDRQRQVWPKSNEYRIEFGPPSQAIYDDSSIGHIGRDFSNVVSVQLISAIIPRFSIDGDCIDLYPYILLEIEELGGIYDGTNASTNRAFCKITFDTVVGKYVHFSPKNYEPFIKYFNPRISMNKLTIRFKKPNGELFDFGTSIDYCHPECVAAHLKKKKRAEKEGKPVRKRVKCKMTSRVNTDEDEPNNSLTFKITTIEKSLDTMFLHPN